MATGLTAALIARRTISTPGGSFAVRGLSPHDVFAIYRRRAGEMALWFERMQASDRFSLDAMPAVATSLLDTAPDIGAELIAAAADAGTDAEAVGIARQLPIGVQVEALEAIASLTFTQEMPPKKLLEIVVRMARGLTAPTPPAT